MKVSDLAAYVELLEKRIAHLERCGEHRCEAAVIANLVRAAMDQPALMETLMRAFRNEPEPVPSERTP